MDLDELLWAIVEMLDDDDDPWVKDTLAWWNRHLKPTKENSNLAKLMRKESENDIAQIRAQRAARHSALVPSRPVNPNDTQEPSTSGKRTRPAEHRDEEDIPRATKRIRQGGKAIDSPRPRKAHTQRHVSTYDDDDELAAPRPKPTHPRPDGQQRPPPKSLPQRHVIFSDDDDDHEDQPTPPRKQMHHQRHPEFDARDHTPPPRKLKSKHPVSISDTIDYEEEALPPKFKARYSTEATGYDVAPASMRAGRPTLDCDGEEQQPCPSKQQRPASASVHHDDEDQPPRPKPKPKPKPRRTAHEHEDSASKFVTEQSSMTGQSRPAPAPSPRPLSPMSQLTDNDDDFPPQAAKLFDAPLAPVKQKGKKKANTALDAPRRTSGRRKNGY